MTSKTLCAIPVLITLAACAAPVTPTNANFNDLRQDFPDLTAVEFSILDQNNDGFVDAEERQAIGADDPDGIEVSDD